MTVPDLTGKDAVEAIRILRQEGLQLKVLPQKRYSEKVGADKIVAQRPEAKNKIKQGRSVEVYLSLGPERIVVPEVIGMTARVAGMTLEQRGLHQGKVIYVSRSKAEADEVLAQFPSAGTVLSGLGAVNLLVNSAIMSGNAFIMPDVIGKNLKNVESYFRSAGLRVGLTQAVDYPGIASGTIVKQTPPAGYKITKDTFIGLYYSKQTETD